MDTFMMMFNDDDYNYGFWYFLLEGVLFGLYTMHSIFIPLHVSEYKASKSRSPIALCNC
jgi:hypothetical protein